MSANNYTYKGYTYRPWNENDEDCTKIWHDFVKADGTTVICDFTPYSKMTEEHIRLWIDLGCPDGDLNALRSFNLNVLWLERDESLT